MGQMLESIRESWEKLSDRERQMLSIMGSVFAFLLVFVVVWTTSSAVADVKEERDEIRKVLSDIARSSDVLAKRDAERLAVEVRFQTRPPPLAAFLESKAKAENLEVRQVIEQPQKEINGFRRQNVRMHFAGVSLRPIMRFLASIEEEQMAVAIERIQIEHYQQGDLYKVEIGVIAFEGKRTGEKTGAAPAEETQP